MSLTEAVPLSSTDSPADWLDQLRLDRRVSEPYYLQLKRQFEALIHTGALPSGHSVPSERDLADMLEISRVTVRRCYEELRNAGLLVTHGNRGGTAVKGVPRISPELSDLKGFSDEMRELGFAPSTRVLTREMVSDRMAASMFNRTSEAVFLRLVRLRFADDIPMSREVAWYDISLAPALADWSGEGSVYDFLRKECGLILTWAKQTIEAMASSPEETEAFGFDAPAPCLLLKRQSYTADNRQVEYVEGTFRGDVYRYQIKLGV
ncbi:MAG: GntR family transcriptional regulator [Zoogloeaceae bacterium]|nr:GntR family transcriptional regulator [Zoogloeaceae bacterium]